MSPKYQIFFVIVVLAIGTVVWRTQTLSPAALPQKVEHIAEEGFEQSPKDTHEYKTLTLENGLEVLLVSDSDADKAAAAMDVGVGYFQDPDDWPGLAHFLEHMLFLGTEPYPDPGEYKDFISQHGGTHNAYTSMENTNYYFDIHPKHLAEALNRFAAFFSSPLFNADLVNREVNAVDSEFQASYKEDGRRIYATLKQVLNPEHPITKFSTGNRKTLHADQPELLREQVIDFYQTYYHPKRMKLVVMGKESIEKLQSMVTEAFQTTNSPAFQPLPPVSATLFAPNSLPMDMSITPLDQRKGLNLIFPLPQGYGENDKKSIAYVTHLINQSGPGSLQFALKERGWALGLSAQQSFDMSSGSVFSIDVQLTELGESHQEDISQQIFAYLREVQSKGIEQWRYEELSSQANLAFNYQNPPNPLDLVSTLAARMQRYQNTNTLISLPYRYKDFDAQHIKTLMDYLQPQNALRLWVSPNAAGDKLEKRYQVTYSSQPGDAQLWNSGSLYDSITLPSANPYITANHQLLTDDTPSEAVIPQKQPDATLQHWHATDGTFKTPRANLFLDLVSRDAALTPQALTNHYLLSRLVEESINQALSKAADAGIYGSISGYDLGIQLSITGYRAKQDLLLDEMLTALTSAPLSQQRFIDMKQRVLEYLEDASKRRPYVQAFDKLDQVLVPGSFDESELIPILNKTTLEALQDYRTKWLSGLKATLLTHGALTQKEASEQASLIKQKLALIPESVARLAVRALKPKQEIAYHSDHQDAVVLVYKQTPFEWITNQSELMHQRAAWALLGRIIAPVFFEQLRTQEQLGYIVSARHRNLLRHPGLYFLVQSPKATAAELSARIGRFINDFQSELAQIPATTFQSNQEGLANDLREKDKSLAERGQAFWSMLLANQPFDEKEQLALAVEKLTKNDLTKILTLIRQETAPSLLIYTKSENKNNN